MIPAPPGGVAGGTANIPNPGVPVNQRAKGHLKLMAIYLRHQEMQVSRTVIRADITLEAIRKVRELREFKLMYKKPDDLPIINAKDWPKTMEAIDEYLRPVLSERMIPLSYVIRKQEDIPEDDDYATYPTIEDETIARAPHFVIDPENIRVPDPI